MRGTFVFPADDRDFLQQLELVANNGAVETVETVYVVTGSTYYVPERLWAFDDPDMYHEAESHGVRPKRRRMVKKLNRFYEEVPRPRLILDAHTHLSGSVSPSATDRDIGSTVRRKFNRYFDDYEFFLGIHGLGEARSPDPEWIRRPEQTAENEISWWGENRKHTLAVYNEAFEPAPVMLRSATQPQQQARRQPESEPEPEPGGEIWD